MCVCVCERERVRKGVFQDDRKTIQEKEGGRRERVGEEERGDGS